MQNLLSSRFLFKIKMYKRIILPVVLCGCETWSLNLSEECRPTVLDNRVLMKMFELRREEETG
jgi:hypothetical protein